MGNNKCFQRAITGNQIVTTTILVFLAGILKVEIVLAEIIDYPDGSSYNGSVSEGVRQGKGRMNWPDGMVYDGQWLADKRHGQGRFTTGDGTSYEGKWFNDQQSGRGRLTSPNNLAWDGFFAEGLPNGIGTATLPDGKETQAAYLQGKMLWKSGDWEAELSASETSKHDIWTKTRESNIALKPHKKAKLFKKEKVQGGVYDGFVIKHDVKGWIPHGWGSITDAAGVSHEGMWVNGRREGLGRTSKPDGTVVDGSWQSDSARDVFIRFGDGTIFHGRVTPTLVPDRKHLAEGIIKESNGSIYRGSFSQGVPHGEGILVDAGKTIYSGSWNVGQPNGEGVMMSPDELFIGNWAAGKRTGTGKRVGADGVVSIGRWEAGKLAHEYRERYEGQRKNGKPHGQGVMHFANGDRYEGTFEMGVIEGKGRLFRENGDIIGGTFRRGDLHGPATITLSTGKFKQTVYNHGLLVWTSDVPAENFDYPLDSDFDGSVSESEKSMFSAMRDTWVARMEDIRTVEEIRQLQQQRQMESQRLANEERRYEDEKRRQSAQDAQAKSERDAAALKESINSLSTSLQSLSW